jgi:DNA-directed RNA polymerase sigma subunit (sigma70/sigma32)
MRELGVRESQIIALRHLSDDPLTLEKLGKLLKISKERVRQIEGRAIKKLKSLVKKLSNKDDLRSCNYSFNCTFQFSTLC